ncbi:MAG: hypothetical protein CL908_08660 [Deltaproteobacteria bacterium]|nr:hypothetical protein [Deltaproteobacteria bacterium]
MARLWPGLQRASVLLALGVAAAAAEPEVFPRPFHILAHRGASAYAPENTLESCEEALARGAVELEIDVQLSKDGEVMLFHDGTLDHKTDGAGLVREATRKELEAMNIGAWFHEEHPDVTRNYRDAKLIALDDLLAAMGRRAAYHIELKSDDEALPARAIEVVRAAGLEDRVIFTSFHFEQVQRVAQISSDFPRTWLVRRLATDEAGVERLPEAHAAVQREAVDKAQAAGLDMVAFPSAELDAGLVEYAHERGLVIRAWGIKSDTDMERAIAAGANGMTTNWPDRLIRRQLEHLSGLFGRND